MRLILPAAVATALLVTACGPAPTTLSMSAADAARARSTGAAPAPAAEGAQAAPPATPSNAPQGAAMPSADALTDAAITGRIRNALVGDPGMAGADVSVNTDNGVVVLAGTVKSHEQTGIASAHAQRQDGVLRVDNHLRPEVS